MGFEVTKEDSFECAMRLIKLGHKPVVLDFASGSNPGGGWRGKQTGTQEESLCRRSNLGTLLENKKYPIPPDALHYVKKVTINKDTNMKPITAVDCAVIASELKCISERSSKYIQSRLTNLYDIAIKNNHDVIVLGAWGLGAFKETDDDAKILAKEMRLCAEKHNIKTVFALYKNKENYDVFVDVLA